MLKCFVLLNPSARIGLLVGGDKNGCLLSKGLTVDVGEAFEESCSSSQLFLSLDL